MKFWHPDDLSQETNNFLRKCAENGREFARCLSVVCDKKEVCDLCKDAAVKQRYDSLKAKLISSLRFVELYGPEYLKEKTEK